MLCASKEHEQHKAYTGAKLSMTMKIDLNAEEVELLLAALSYSTRGVRGADGTPPFIRQQQIESLDQLHRKFQEVARGETTRRE